MAKYEVSRGSVVRVLVVCFVRPKPAFRVQQIWLVPVISADESQAVRSVQGKAAPRCSGSLSLSAQLGCPLSRWSAAVMDIPGISRVSDIPVDNLDATSRDGSYAANGRFFPRFCQGHKIPGMFTRSSPSCCYSGECGKPTISRDNKPHAVLPSKRAWLFVTRDTTCTTAVAQAAYLHSSRRKESGEEWGGGGGRERFFNMSVNRILGDGCFLTMTTIRHTHT